MKKVDYFINVVQGTFSESGSRSEVFRVDVHVNNRVGPIDMIGEAVIYKGFGPTRQEALKDFISRNPSNVLDAIFDLVA